MSFKKCVDWRNRPSLSAESRPFIPWLQDRGSLTARLQATGPFSVRLLRQGLAIPTSDEACALRIQRKRLAWVREVALFCAGKPLVFAHSVLPYRPRGPMTRWLARMGNRSLGAILFAHPGFKRSKLKCKRLDYRHRLFLPAVKAMQLTDGIPRKLWARRSFFSFGTQAVLVTEVFSPALHTQSPTEQSPENN